MESVHDNPKEKKETGLLEKLGNLPQAIFGRKLEREELIIWAIIILLLTKNKSGDRPDDKGQGKDQGLSLMLNGVKDFLSKLEDKDILTIMLLYIML